VTATTQPDVDIVLPAYNEAAIIEDSVDRLLRAAASFTFSWRVTIVDSGSTDATWAVTRRIEARHPQVRALRVDRPGRGLALRTAWSGTDAAIVAYIDADLSGGPSAIAELVERLREGRADVAIASRAAPGSHAERSRLRHVLSRGYVELVQWVAQPPFLDAQCGLKALDAGLARQLLDQVVDDGWFFDTELLLAAWKAGAEIDEVAVRWIDRSETRVRLPGTVVSDIAGLARTTASRRTVAGPVPAGASPRRPQTPFLGAVGLGVAALTAALLRRAGIRWSPLIAGLVGVHFAVRRVGVSTRRAWSST
jgi:hypothetical protein